MPHEKPRDWPLLPSFAASVAHQLCMTMADLVEEEAGTGMSRRTYLKLYGLATAAELFSRDAARWYGSLKGDDQNLLDALEERYAATKVEASS